MKHLSNSVQKFVHFQLLLLLRRQHQSSSDGDRQSLIWRKYFSAIRGQISRMMEVPKLKVPKISNQTKINHLIRRKEWNQRAVIVDLRHFFNCNIEAWRFSTFTYLASTLGMSPCLVLTELSVFVTNGNILVISVSTNPLTPRSTWWKAWGWMLALKGEEVAKSRQFPDWNCLLYYKRYYGDWRLWGQTFLNACCS